MLAHLECPAMLTSSSGYVCTEAALSIAKAISSSQKVEIRVEIRVEKLLENQAAHSSTVSLPASATCYD
jgi:hypothetical protein